MIRQSWVILLAVFLPLTASAQAPRWAWKTGQVLTYRVDQQTRIVDQVEDNKVETKTKLQLVKRWQVTDVDAKGMATLELSLNALSMETELPDGKKLTFDSAKPDAATPGLSEQLQQYVGKKLAVLRLTPLGKVAEVKESNFGPKSRFVNELPFLGVLPSVAPEVGTSWSREYNLTLAPPQGTGESTPTVQKYTCKSVNNASLVIDMVTELTEPPEAAADRIPWLQYLPKGTLTFDMQAGRLQKAELLTEEKVEGHQGDGSVYTIRTTYTEEFVKE